jgi:hypothetical protein
MATPKTTVLGLGLLSLAACGPGGHGDDGDGKNARPDGGPGEMFIDAAVPDAGPQAACNQIDFLFVIDNSSSMDDVQAKLVAAFPQFIQVIDQYQNAAGQSLDYRIAVTTTGRDVAYIIKVPVIGTEIPFNEMGDDGEFRPVPGQSRRWIERSDGNVSSTFSSLGTVGTGGPSLEMQLLAMEWSLSKRMTEGAKPNAGFLRDDALLAVVMVSDEDDCSIPTDGFTIASDACDPDPPGMLTPEHFKTFLDDVKGGPGRWALAMIAIPPGNGGGCGGNDDYQAEGERLKAFADLAGVNGVFADLCATTYSQALGDALDTFTAACEHIPPIE